MAASTEDFLPLWEDFEYKPHQIFGVQWMLNREKATHASGGILADEMGLGKTIQIVSLIKHSAPTDKNLLVAPVAVLAQWKTTLLRAGITVKMPSKNNIRWVIEEGGAELGGPTVCVVGYEAATRHSHLVLHREWARIIYDEAHRLCGPLRGEGAPAIALACEAEHKWLLTATPVVNTQANIVRLLQIVGLRDQEAAYNRDIFKTYILARTMDQLRATFPDAPPVPEHTVISLPFDTEKEASFYRGRINQITNRWNLLEELGGRGVALERLKLLMRLRQLSLHPQVYIAGRKAAFRGVRIPDWTEGSTKFNAIRRLVIAEPGKKWIVFCHFKEEMRLLHDMLAAEPAVSRVQLYNGGLSAGERAAVLAASHEPLVEGASEVLLVQLQSGGVGLNLQHFQRIVFSGPWWTQALMDQAVGRAVRIGQREIVRVYHLRLVEEEMLNIDAFMSEKAEAKGALCREVLEAAETRVGP